MMPFLGHRLIYLLWLPFLFPTLLWATEYPDYQSIFINDFAEVLDADSENRITELLTAHKQVHNIEMTVVTLPSLAHYQHFGSIESFATGLFNTWGVGNAERNDGVMILVAVADRSLRIELGEGYPKHLDQTAKTIIDEVMVPHFKQQDFAKGIEAGVKESIALLRLDAKPHANPTPSESSGWSIKGFIAAAVGALMAAFGGKHWFRRRARRCPKCSGPMQRLSEEQDDLYLSEGQQLEESLGSMNYDVWYCVNDGTTQVTDYGKWFSGYSKCKHCRHKTVESSSTTLRHATTSSTGRKRIDYDCQHCHATWSEHRTIPKVSSSSSSGSFGGGSSSGGGASGKW